MTHAHFSAPSGASTPARLDALFWAVGAVIAALTAVAFWLSYDHLHTVASSHGLAGMEIRSWAWPSCLDAFVVTGELLMLRAGLRRAGIDWLAVALTVVGSGGSIALNVAGVGSSASVLDYVVAGIPPTAALLAFAALMRQLHQALAGTAVVTPVPLAVPVEAAPAPRPATALGVDVPAGTELLPIVARPVRMRAFVWQSEITPGTAGTGRDLLSRTVRLAANGTAPRSVTSPVPPTGTAGTGTAWDEHVRTAKAVLATAPDATGTDIARLLGTSDGYGRKVKRAALAPTGT
jgi:hypothetical protein